MNVVHLSRPERRLLRRLVGAGATDAAHAHPLPGLGRAPAGWRDRLESAGLLRATTSDRCYVDLARYRQYRLRRAALVGLAGLVVAVLIAGALLLGLAGR